jgi:hypothetical protein
MACVSWCVHFNYSSTQRSGVPGHHILLVSALETHSWSFSQVLKRGTGLEGSLCPLREAGARRATASPPGTLRKRGSVNPGLTFWTVNHFSGHWGWGVSFSLDSSASLKPEPQCRTPTDQGTWWWNVSVCSWRGGSPTNLELLGTSS